MEQFVLERSLVLFVVDNFRLRRFFHKKTPRKSWFFCVFSFTDVNSSLKEINVPFWCKKATHFDPCIYRPFLFWHIFHCFWKVGVLRLPYVIALKMQKILYLLWFLQVIFGLTGAPLCHRNLLKSGLLSKFQNFLHKKHDEKLIFLCLDFTDVNSSQKEINVPFWCKKESHFDRCMYRGFLFLHIFHCFWKVGVLRVPYVIVLKMQKILYLFWFLEVLFGLTGAL